MGIKVYISGMSGNKEVKKKKRMKKRRRKIDAKCNLVNSKYYLPLLKNLNEI